MNTWRTTSKRTPVKGMGGRFLSSDSRETSGSMCKDQVRPGMAAGWGLRRIGEERHTGLDGGAQTFSAGEYWVHIKAPALLTQTEASLKEGGRSSGETDSWWEKELSLKEETFKKTRTPGRSWPTSVTTGRKKPSSRFSGRRSWRPCLRTKKASNQEETHHLHAEVRPFLVSWCLLKLKQNPLEARKDYEELYDLNTFHNNGLRTLGQTEGPQETLSVSSEGKKTKHCHRRKQTTPVKTALLINEVHVYLFIYFTEYIHIIHSEILYGNTHNNA